jgi:hypothetical protein
MKEIKNFDSNLRKFFTISLLAISGMVNAQIQNVTLGQPSQIRFAIPNVTNQDKCHIEVSLPNQQKIAIDVDGPQFNAEVNFTPDQIGNTTLKWEGKRKNRGLNSVNACPGAGVIQISVKGNTEYIAQQWNQYFARVPEPIGECVKVGMDISQLKYQILADPNAVLTALEDQKVKPIYEKCEAFAKQNQPRKGAPCTLASQNNLRTTCDGVYAERQPDGRLKTISRTEAIKLQFEGKPWTIGVLENLDVRATRLKQEDEEKAKQAATIAAQKEAEERERKFRESPEYKKQQAELERKRLAEEKQAAAIKAKEDQERELKAQREKASLDAQRAEEEKSRQKLASNRVKGNFKCSNSAMVDEISGRETYLKGNEVWSMSLNGSSGILISPTGQRDLLTYQSSVSGPKSSGDIYSFNNSEIMLSLQLMVDNGSNGKGKSSLITKMKPVANMKILMIGFCNS